MKTPQDLIDVLSGKIRFTKWQKDALPSSWILYYEDANMYFYDGVYIDNDLAESAIKHTMVKMDSDYLFKGIVMKRFIYSDD